ncbi:RDD family protein [Streptomyces syringium]|uniref:RDD family protein n=1 Tax=Streptomyces syringium TaxID=76729 RepID=UPI00340A6BFF
MIDYQHQQHPHQPYAPQPQYAHPYQQPYQPQPYPQPPVVPEPVGDARRMLSAVIDGAITVFAGFGLAHQLADDKTVGVFWGYVAAGFFGVSFVHHVLGAVIFRTTVGKFLLVTRVVREADAGRPRFWQSVRRWLLGLTWLPLQPLWSLFGAEGELYEDACGLRNVRSKDLR